jgi:ribosome recycling factor
MLDSVSMPNRIDEHKHEFQSALDHYQQELKGMRTGRANAALVEGIRIEAYGQSMDLKSNASVTIPDNKTIQIEPWDKSLVKDIEKALIDANLGMMPNVAGTVIRLVMPPMNEENRKNMVKLVNQREEHAKITIRNIREQIKNAIQNDEKAKEISEDEKRRELEKLDKLVSEWNAKIEKITADKEEEIMTV